MTLIASELLRTKSQLDPIDTTASNIGTEGVGVYYTKAGRELQFRKINSGSSKVMVEADVANNEIDIDINESSLQSSIRSIIVKCIQDSTDLEITEGIASVVIPSSLNLMNLDSANAHVFTASSSGSSTIQLYNVTKSVDMLSNLITIDQGEYDSKDSASSSVVNSSNKQVNTGDVIRIDVDSVGTGIKGLEVRLEFVL